MPKPWRQFMNDADNYVVGHIYALEANSVNELFAEYERAYHNMAIGLEAVQNQYGQGDTWSATDAGYRQRTEVLLAQIAREMEGLSLASQDMILRNAMNSYYAGFLGRAWISETMAGRDLTMPLLPTTAVRAAILKPYDGSTFIDRFKANEADFQARIRRSIVQSQIEGESIYQAQKRIANELGLAIDRRRKADRQANRGAFNRTQMIARTEILRTSNLGAIAYYEANDDVLRGWEWRATSDDRTCEECGDLDGQVFAFKDSRNPPPAHPNCLLPGTMVVAPERIVGATKSFYIGPCVEITLADGRELSITENHPILTEAGWKNAGDLRDGDNVISTLSREGMLFSVHPNNDNRPVVIEEIVGALMEDGEMITRSVPVSPKDFHGDGRYTYGDVDIVNVDSLLRDNIEVWAQPVGQYDFGGRRMRQSPLYGFGSSDPFINTSYPPTVGSMGVANHSLDLFGGGARPTCVHGIAYGSWCNACLDDMSAQYATTYAHLAREGLLGFPVAVTRDIILNIGDIQTVAARGVVAEALQPSGDSLFVSTEGASKFLNAFASDITLSQIVNVKRFEYVGHVYNLQVDIYGLYISNGIVTSNCRCAAVPVFLDNKVNDLVKVRSYKEWAQERGAPAGLAGDVFNMKAQKPPKTGKAA